MSLLTDLVAYWKLEEASGNRVDEIAGNNLAPVGHDSGNASGKIGSGVLIDDFWGDNISVADNSAVKITGDKSISFWINVGSDAGGRHAGIMDKTSDWQISKNNSEQIVFTIYDSVSGSVSATVTTPTISASTWYHVIATYTASDKIARAYLDNGSEYASSALANSPANGTGSFEVGRWLGVFYYDGVVDELGMWDRVLSSGERTELYNGGAGLSYDSFGGGSFVFKPAPMGALLVR